MGSKKILIVDDVKDLPLFLMLFLIYMSPCHKIQIKGGRAHA